MYFYIKGLLIDKSLNYIVISNNDIAYQIFTPYSNYFTIGNTYIVYIVNIVKEDENYLIGLKNKEDKELFSLLLTVNGVGPKTALNIFKHASANEIKLAINNKDLNFFIALPNIGNKVASQILLDLKGKLIESNIDDKFIDIRRILRNYGFKQKEIMNAINKIRNLEGSKEYLLKEALRNIKNE